MALGLASPLPCPPTARRSRCKGARNAREPADAPLAARPAPAVAIPLSFASHAKAQRRRREQEIGPMSRGSTPSGRQRTGGYDSRRRASETFAARPRMRPGRKQLPRRGAPGFRGRRKAAYWAGLLDAGHIGEELGIPSCTIFHATYTVQDSRIVTAGEEWSDALK